MVGIVLGSIEAVVFKTHRFVTPAVIIAMRYRTRIRLIAINETIAYRRTSDGTVIRTVVHLAASLVHIAPGQGMMFLSGADGLRLFLLGVRCVVRLFAIEAETLPMALEAVVVLVLSHCANLAISSGASPKKRRAHASKALVPLGIKINGDLADGESSVKRP